MNYLAHLLLAGEDPSLRLGGMLGDFVKGPLPGSLPPEVAHGVALHRRIDAFTDGHPVFRTSRERVSVARRRYAGVMVDMFYDHFLAANWSVFCSVSLDRFSAEAYGLMETHIEVLPERLATILPSMRKHDWLTSYRDAAAIGRALDRMSSHRLRQPNGMAGGGDELLAAYAGFEADFHEFFPQALEFAREWIARTPLPDRRHMP